MDISYENIWYSVPTSDSATRKLTEPLMTRIHVSNVQENIYILKKNPQ